MAETATPLFGWAPHNLVLGIFKPEHQVNELLSHKIMDIYMCSHLQRQHFKKAETSAKLKTATFVNVQPSLRGKQLYEHVSTHIGAEG